MNDEIITLKDGRTIRLSDLFIECNNRYFNGNLQRAFLFTFIGRRGCCSLVNYKLNKKGRITSRFIGIACNIDWTEEDLRRVLLREMASLYAVSCANQPIRKYGKEFKALIEELNSKYGLCLSAEKYRFDINYKPKPYFLRWILKMIKK